ncbi:MAG: hypothetical protein ACI4MA_00430 [Treponema sp.]
MEFKIDLSEKEIILLASSVRQNDAVSIVVEKIKDCLAEKETEIFQMQSLIYECENSPEEIVLQNEPLEDSGGTI